ncbi:hypothetical protein BFP70_19365 [Thioclava sp. SK-1]|uniref:restriction endonuclease subunit S n=1 Tax=Thioclava sp. SK-1 TaxID=1889770 RepID=UPI0008249C7C|nr:restriction endonuclease subunit S [Thioclava sp. SK-1]OCX57387.1 hypothetical protein BFP70_19365 [Thioclava sp. SK-1]
MSWQEKAISDLGKVVTGKTPSTKNREFYDGEFPFVTPTDLDWQSYFVRTTHSTITKLASDQHKNQMLPAGATTFTCIGNTIGKCGITAETSLTNQQINSIVPNDEHDKRFVYYLMLHNKDAIRSIGLSGGAAQPIINKSTFSNVKVRVPDLPTQERIAGVLSAYDHLIENNRRRIALLEQAARLLYREWCVHFRFPGFETAKFVDGLPEGWEVRKVKDLLARLKSKPTVRKDEYQEYGQWPCVDQGQDFIGGYTDNREAIYHDGLPLIVFGDHTRALKFVDFPFARGADGTQIIQSNEERLPQELFYFSLINVDLSNYAYARHFKFLKDKEIIIPTEGLGKSFSERARAVFDQVRTLRDQNRKLAKARDLLLPRLMDGRLPIPE